MNIYNKNKLHNNNGIINNVGVQNIQETHLHVSSINNYTTKELIEGTKKVANFSVLSVISLVGFVADVCAIFSYYKNTINNVIEGNPRSDLSLWGVIFAIILAPILCNIIKGLICLWEKRTLGKYILKDNVIYKIKPKQCPKCGKLCGGKLQICIEDGYTYFVCHRDKSHKQLIEYNEIFEMMEDDDSISSNV